MADKRRRKSLGIFKTGQHAEDLPSEKGFSVKRKGFPPPILTSERIPEGQASPIPTSASSEKFEQNESPRIRPRTLQKSNRTSVFGSLRSLKSLDDEEQPTKMDSKAFRTYEDDEAAINIRGLFGNTVLHHGEVQTASGMFRKRTQYLVLTETHLIRFRSQSKASEVFMSVPPSLGRNSTNRQSAASTISHHDAPTATSAEITFGIALDQVVAVYKLDDGKPYFTIEVSHLDQESKRTSSMQMQLNEPREAEMWLNALRTAANQLRIRRGPSEHEPSLKHVARSLERERDYDPEHFRMFPVVQRASHRSTGRSSADDLSKLNSTICYLAIGINKIHLVPLGRTSGRSSTSSLAEIDSPLSFGLMTLMSVSLQANDDYFQLVFRAPLRSSFALHLASSVADRVALAIRYAAEYLRPEWIRQPFVFNVPEDLEDSINATHFPEEDHKCFDRTLIAYSAAYNVDPSRICYTIVYECEDSPCFQLLAPTNQKYSAVELLAVMRALRYNESFVSISFADINLTSLRFLYDPFGTDVDSMSTRSGTAVNIPNHHNLPILLQEIRGLALKSKRLRRLDFTRSITTPEHLSKETQSSCGIPEALVPLCKKSLTNVDWFILNGIKLADSDLDYLVDAASERACHLRALEVGDSGLSVHDMDVLLSTLAIQENTMEVIDISSVQGRFSTELFQRQIGYFGHIRRLNLTRVQKTTVTEPLIPPETLFTWRLEALYLSQTILNEQTVDSISAYLLSPRSDTLRELRLDQCGISGKDVAVFFQSMTRERGKARQIHLSVSENRLSHGYTKVFKAIAQNYGPSHFTAKMIEFEKEHHFLELVLALTKNTTLKALDISKASLPYDATEETCEALRAMFSQNQCLEELDISGEHAHLDSARFGIGLNLALTGLKTNKSLKVLKIEHQNLGMQGANTLAEVLEQNQTLLEIHCEKNGINLQSFTVLVNALQKNKTLLYMSTMDRDREVSLDKIKREIGPMGTADGDASPTKLSGLARSLTGTAGPRSHRFSIRASNAFTSAAPFSDHDVTAAMCALNDRWNGEVVRLHRFLQRNYCLARGLPWDDSVEKGSMLLARPSTAESLGRIFEMVKLDSTPTAEKRIPVGSVDLNKPLPALILPDE